MIDIRAQQQQLSEAIKELAQLKKTIDILAATVKALEGRIADLEGAKRGNRQRPTASGD